MTVEQVQELLQDVGNPTLNMVNIKEALIDLIENPTAPTGGGDWTEVVVPITAVEMANMGTTPISLLPTLAANQYYEYEGILEKNGDGQSSYNVDERLAIVGSDSWVGLLVDALKITMSMSNPLLIAQFSSKNSVIGVAGSDAYTWAPTLGEGLMLTLWSGSNPTSNTATYRAKIKYKIHTFGA